MISEKIKGFINFDAQFIDYTGNTFDFTLGNEDPIETDNENFVNDVIDNELNNKINYSLGAELAYKKIRGRAGINLIASPFFLDSNFDQIYSAGVGYRMNKVFFDLAYQFRSFSEGYVPYQAPNAADDLSLVVDTNVSKLALTIGIKL